MNGMSELVRKYVESTTKMVVDKPEMVNVSVSVSTKAVIIQIRVDKSDCGKIIGKQGRTIDAVKVLCLAIKNTKYPDDPRRILVEVLEDENSDFKYRRNDDAK